MKVYTHPTINLPAGAVVVKFFDESKEGTESTPDIIIEIGDVEEGYDTQLGEVKFPICELKLRNKNNYLLGTLLNTSNLQILITVNNDLYFYGDIDFGSLNPDNTKDPSADLIYTNFSITAQSIFTLLNKCSGFYFNELCFNQLAEHRFYNDYLNGEEYLFFSVYIYEMTRLLTGVKHDTEDNILFETNRLFSTLSESLSSLKDISIMRDHLAFPLPANTFVNRCDTALNVLGELMREFMFYISLYLDGSDIRVKVREKDKSRFITLGTILERNREFNYVINSIKIDLDGNNSDQPVYLLRYESDITLNQGDEFEMAMHHTNVITSVDEWSTSLIYGNKTIVDGHTFFEPINKVLNYGDVEQYDSFQQAIYNEYKNLYYNNKNWFSYVVKGLNATYNGSTKMEFLQPGYNFTDGGNNYHIHTVRKSLMNNRTEILVLKF